MLDDSEFAAVAVLVVDPFQLRLRIAATPRLNKISAVDGTKRVADRPSPTMAATTDLRAASRAGKAQSVDWRQAGRSTLADRATRRDQERERQRPSKPN